MSSQSYHALLMHGLNNIPGMMNPIANQLARLGVGASIGKLTGHWEETGRLERFKAATGDVWLGDIKDAFSQASKSHADKKLIFVGYSMGGLLGMLLAQSGMVEFDKIVLFAPSIYLRPWSYLPKLLTPFTLNIPSQVPPALRANSSTPVSAYAALYDLVKRFEPIQLKCPVLTIMHPRDEFVNFSRVRDWAGQNRETSLLTIRNTVGFNHLVTDEASVGAENWQLIWGAAKSFIETPAN